MIWQFGQFKSLLNLLHQSDSLLFRIQFFRLFQFVKSVLLAVHFAQIQQRFFVTPLRYGQGHPLDAYVYWCFKDDFIGLAIHFFPDLQYGQGHDFVVTLIQFLFEFKCLCLIDAPVCHMQVIDVCRFLVGCQRKNIHIIDGLAHHFAFGAEVFKQQIFLFDDFSLFKPHFFCQLLHLLQQ